MRLDGPWMIVDLPSPLLVSLLANWRRAPNDRALRSYGRMHAEASIVPRGRRHVAREDSAIAVASFREFATPHESRPSACDPINRS